MAWLAQVADGDRKPSYRSSVFPIAITHHTTSRFPLNPSIASRPSTLAHPLQR